MRDHPPVKFPNALIIAKFRKLSICQSHIVAFLWQSIGIARVRFNWKNCKNWFYVRLHWNLNKFVTFRNVAMPLTSQLICREDLFRSRFIFYPVRYQKGEIKADENHFWHWNTNVAPLIEFQILFFMFENDRKFIWLSLICYYFERNSFYGLCSFSHSLANWKMIS